MYTAASFAFIITALITAVLQNSAPAQAQEGFPQPDCPSYDDYSKSRNHSPYSSGRFHLPFQRPLPRCRTFNSTAVESTIRRVTSKIKDPDFARLFENAYPNTLDTTIRWRGHASNNTAEELTFIITGDINAMWLRDSANQLQSYLPSLKPSTSPDSLASLYRGVINLQARYLLTSPYCQAFQPPAESGIPPETNTAFNEDNVKPPYSNTSVFECKYEIDSLGAFLQVSADYHRATQNSAFFGKFQWVHAVRAVMNVANEMKTPTYAANGSVLESPYTFTRLSETAAGTLENDGAGAPVARDTGLVRSAFRPSDDACVFQLFVPGNAFFAAKLAEAAEIAEGLDGQEALAREMREMSEGIRQAVEKYGKIRDSVTGEEVYAFEVDGFGSHHLIDDANIPSLLSLPFYNYTPTTNPTYQTTRRQLLSPANPYFSRGPVLSAIGGPHTGPGHGWPMSSIVRVLTSDDEREVVRQLGQLVGSTDGLGLVHESVGAWNGSDWTRPWFSWANGLFGQMVVRLEGRMPEVLRVSFQ